jgi:aminocarboxymuconate-semialdehyde decarboxylase
MIDIHTHCSPSSYPPSPAEAIAWPSMRGNDSAADLLDLWFGERFFRSLDERSWDAAARLAEMDRDAISLQALSPMPELLSYWLPQDAAVVLVEHVNRFIGEMVQTAPTRFAGLGAVTLQDVDAAVAQVGTLKGRHGLAGIEVGSNVNGVYLGDERFDDFWAACAEADLSVFIHGLHPLAFKACQDRSLTAFAGIPMDVAATAATLLVRGIPERHPGLRIALSHGGGGLGELLGRLDLGWTSTKCFGGRLDTPPSELAKRLFVDSNVYDCGAVAGLDRHFPAHVCLGSDYPYHLAQSGLATYAADAGLDPERTASLRDGAARAFLKL